MMATMTGHDSALNEWLFKAGIIRKDELVYRVVIDIKVDDVARVYVQKFLDSGALEVDPPNMSGCVIRVGEESDAHTETT
jgi:hypothetical protein